MKNTLKITSILLIVCAVLLTSCATAEKTDDTVKAEETTRAEQTTAATETAELHELSFGFDKALKDWEEVETDPVTVKISLPLNVDYAVDEDGNTLAEQYQHIKGLAPELLRNGNVLTMRHILIEKVEKDYVLAQDIANAETRPDISDEYGIGGTFITDKYVASEVYKTEKGFDCFTYTYTPTPGDGNATSFVYIRITDDLVFKFCYFYDVTEADLMDTIINSVSIER